MTALCLVSLVLQFAYGYWVQPRNRAVDLAPAVGQPGAALFHGDEKGYYWIAVNLLGGRGFDQGEPDEPARPTAARPPGYPILLAGLFAVTGPGLHFGFALNRLFATLTVLAAYGVAFCLFTGIGDPRFAKENSGPDAVDDPSLKRRAHRAGLIAAALTVVWPHGFFFAGSLMTESASALLYTLALFTTIRMTQRPTSGWAVSAGFVWAATLLTRSAFVLQVFSLGVWFVLARRRIPRRSMIAFAVAAALLYSPWVLRNWIRFDKLLLTNSTSGVVFAGAHRPDVMAGSPGSWKHPVVPPSTVYQGKVLHADDELRANSYFWHQGMDNLKRLRAREVLRLLAYKVARMLAPVERVTHDSVCRPCNLVLSVLFLPIFALIIVGVWFLRSRPLLVTLMGLQFAALLCTAIVFWGGTRLRAPMEPVCWAIASIGVATWLERRSTAAR